MAHNHAGNDEDDRRKHEGNSDYCVTNGSASGFLHCAPLGTENATARGSPDPPPNVKKSFIRNHELTEISIGVLRKQKPRMRGASFRLRGKDSNLDYLIQSWLRVFGSSRRSRSIA
jgi:hypothetical protein